MEDVTEMQCSYCGKYEYEVDIILSSDMAQICDECILLMYETLQMVKKASENSRPHLRLITNKD